MRLAPKQGRHGAVVLGLIFLALAFTFAGGCSRPAGSGSTPPAPSATEAQLREKNADLANRVVELQAQLTASKPPDEQMSIVFMNLLPKRRLMVRDARLLAMPREGAPVLGHTGGDGTIVELIDAGEVNGSGVWLYVAAPAYASPINNHGWIRESDTELLTRANVMRVTNLDLKAGTPVWEGLDDPAEIAKTAPVPLDSDLRGLIGQRYGDYVHMSFAGGRDLWVEAKYLIYPPVE